MEDFLANALGIVPAFAAQEFMHAPSPLLSTMSARMASFTLLATLLLLGPQALAGQPDYAWAFLAESTGLKAADVPPKDGMVPQGGILDEAIVGVCVGVITSPPGVVIGCLKKRADIGIWIDPLP